MVQPLTKVRVRHHQVDQAAVLGTQCTWHAQRAGVSGADGALGLRLCSCLDQLGPSATGNGSGGLSNVDAAGLMLIGFVPSDRMARSGSVLSGP